MLDWVHRVVPPIHYSNKRCIHTIPINDIYTLWMHPYCVRLNFSFASVLSCPVLPPPPCSTGSSQGVRLFHSHLIAENSCTIHELGGWALSNQASCARHAFELLYQSRSHINLLPYLSRSYRDLATPRNTSQRPRKASQHLAETSQRPRRDLARPRKTSQKPQIPLLHLLPPRACHAESVNGLLITYIPSGALGNGGGAQLT